jgi:hypothetical protein
MATRGKMVTAVFRDRNRAQDAYDRLVQRGYTSDELNVIMSEATRAACVEGRQDHFRNAGNLATEGMGVGGAIGTAVGATVAALAAIGTSVALPGLGLIVAGPAAAAFAGAGAGALTGGVLGALIGAGFTESNAQAYQDLIREGGVVVGVVPRNEQDAHDIQAEFEELHGENVYYG